MADRSLAIDHIIILVPYDSLNHPPQWITSNFTITPGGRHADGRTENRLICFKDGSYFELIAFINDDPKLRKGHWWDKPFGIVDFAFTTADGAEKNFTELQERLKAIEGCDVRYEKPREGGRRRDDGQELKWHVTFPDVTQGHTRGELPFFCHDITSRSLRVPFSEESTTHPTSAYGIRDLTVFLSEERVDALTKAFSAIFDAPNASKEYHHGLFTVHRMNKVENAVPLLEFKIQAPTEEWQIKAMRERGGILLGNMLVGTNSPVSAPGLRLRIDNEGEGAGGVFLDHPSDSTVPSGDDSKARYALESSTNREGLPSISRAKGQRTHFQPPSGNLSGKAEK
ncbi:glyoxalase-like domain-containing protein [Bisporella sp. PMI_857]|nr:glyoxalase-like domain-containing protein [Bisporella sp. PMI_857]